jgi:tol-pal system protein YbgF
MARNHLTAVFCAAALLAAPVAALGADREHQQIMADIRMLQEQTTRLQLAMASLDEALRQISAKIDTQTDATRRAFADNQLSVSAVADGVRIMRERFNDTNVRISSLSQEVEALRIAIPPLSPALTQLATDPATGLLLDAAPPAVAGAAPALNPGMSPQRMYDTAWADYTNGQWALSIQGFEAYLKTYPRSELADDAQFYIGQTYYADGEFQDAVEAFDDVLLNYPDGDVVPDASYKRGLALDHLGYADRAQQAFELVVTNYPDSTMATLAQQALDRLNQQ